MKEGRAAGVHSSMNGPQRRRAERKKTEYKILGNAANPETESRPAVTWGGRAVGWRGRKGAKKQGGWARYRDCGDGFTGIRIAQSDPLYTLNGIIFLWCYTSTRL